MAFGAALAAVLFLSAPSAALQIDPGQAQNSDGPETANLGTIEVVGARRSRERQAQAFVAAVAKAPEGSTLARWQDNVCVGVANLVSPYAQLVADRVSAVAAELGLRTGEPGCQPDLMIMFAADADAVAQTMVSSGREGFSPNLRGASLGAKALSEFEHSDRPVRWWHVSLSVEIDTGTPPLLTTVRTDTGEMIVPVLQVRQMSHLRTGLREDLKRVIIIVDANRTQPANLASVADYVSFVALAQVNPDVDANGQPSILSLFSEHPSTDRLTEWDMNYLHSLYGATRDRRAVRQQASEIAHAMADRIGDAPR